MKKILAVIPARGGSKRFPRKNIATLGLKPLIDYTIQAALSSKLLEDHVFSSDDDEIIKIAEKCGAFAPFKRPKNIATDHVRNSATMLHALEFMEGNTNKNYDAIMLLQPTSPLRTGEHIDDAIRLYRQSKSISLASMKGPYQKRDINLKKIINDRAVNLIDKNIEYYIYNSAIYIIDKEYLIKNKSFVSEDEVPMVMDEISSIDIDEEYDLIRAEAALHYIRKFKDE